MPMRLCQCPRCHSNLITCADGTVLRGKYLSKRNKQKHMAEFRKHTRLSLTSFDSAASQATDPATINPKSPSSISSEINEVSSTHPDLSSGDELVAEPTSVALMVSIFIDWLHIFCNISKENCRSARNFLLQIVLASQNTPSTSFTLAQDPRTLIKIALPDFKIRKTVYCTNCYSLYPTIDIPWKCTYKETTRCSPCDNDLFCTQSSFRSVQSKGSSMLHPYRMTTNDLAHISIPRGYYVTQSMDSWIRWFLAFEGIEDAIESWAQEVHSSSDETIGDIQKGTGWKELSWASTSETGSTLNLCFSLFVDWFNPRNNKLAGKQQSMGIVAMACLNLPPQLRNKLSHIFIAGIMPGPQAPNKTTISHLLVPLVDDLKKLQEPSQISTFKQPNGRMIQVRLLTLIGDTGATHKVGGFASHSAKYYCTWCLSNDTELSNLKCGKPRTGQETREKGLQWKEASKNQQTQLLRQSGVRYSELNRLEYCDPVKHLALGMMHNWMEGILAHHFRIRWGFQDSSHATIQKRASGKKDCHGHQKKRKVEGLVGEVEGIWGTESDDADEDGESSKSDIVLDGGETGGVFSAPLRRLFREKLAGLVLPDRIEGLPKDLGSVKHGKLKAMQWHSLWVFAIPLIILELFIDNVENIGPKSKRYRILQNTAFLVRCTNLITSWPIKQSTGRKFQQSYEKYNNTSQEIFKNLKVLPNHHYALHIPEQMETWGPMNGVAEFWGKRLVGALQKIKTNERFGDMEQTMMMKIIGQQRLLVHAVMGCLSEENPKKSQQRRRNGIVFKSEEYNQILEHVRQEDGYQQVRAHWDFPHPEGSLVLQRQGRSVQAWHGPNNLKITPMPPHNCIQYCVGDLISYAKISQIYEYLHPKGTHAHAISIHPIQNRFAKDLTRPSKTFQFLCYLMKVVVGEEMTTQSIISPAQITNLMAYHSLSAGTFGIETNGIAMVPCNHLGYLAINETTGPSLF
ncbi:hypothetical protein O181_046411 [Austropuccinia psidii MF-1]|uniref:Uncharacterized protein n=1 Tax=Austropuccinia psidii MF-1 TaxID=1389203 RepID=A0A9Q3HIL5_9BASI|nr:hypothetical protein [Austropuccinia psidii MF-1]